MTSTLDPVLSMVIADATEGFIVIADMVPGGKGLRSHSFPVEQAADAQAYALELSKSRQVYVESALQRVAPPPNARGTAEGTSQFSLVSLDFDGAWGLHKQACLPASPDDLPRVLEAAGVPVPSIVLRTGGGLLALWQLREAFQLADGDAAARVRAKKASSGFQRRIREAAAARFGWKLDNTADLSRLIRIPGTLNHKFDPPRPVEVMA